MAEFDFNQSGQDWDERARDRGYPGPQMPTTLPQSPFPPNVPVGNTGYSTPSAGNEDIRRQLESVSRGVPVTDDDVRDAQRLNQGDTLQSRMQEFAAQYERRAAPTQGRTSDSQGGRTAAPPSAFSDPLGGPVNAFANERFARLASPPRDSGQAMLEDALRRISQQFEQGGYTTGEMEQFQTQAIDPLERLRSARKQQVLQQLSQRGIAVNPASPHGVAKAALDDVDRQFDTLRSQQQTQIGTQAANERRARMLQSLEMLSGLASTEEGRLDKAFEYRKVPLQLGDRAFTQAMQLYGQANPINLFNPAMQMASIGQNQQSGQQNALAQLAWLLLNGGR